LVIATAYGHISGAHINPAVTIAVWLSKGIGTLTAVLYIIVQLLGGVAASYVLRYILGGPLTGLGATTLASGTSPIQAMVLEAILTFFLANTVLNTALGGKGGTLAPVAIGLTLAFGILMGGPLTGGSLNPARTLGPAIATANYTNLSSYLIGQVAGGIAAAFLYLGFFKSGK